MDTPRRDLKAPVIFSLTSGKGGVGKTSITVNLAFALCQLDHRVLVVDGDLGLANVDVLLRLNVEKTIRDVVENGDDPLSAVVYVEPNLGVLPSSSGVPQMLRLGSREHTYLEKILKSIAREFDFVLVDTAAGIGPSVLWLNNFVDCNIIVVSPDPTSMTDAYALIKVMDRDYARRHFHVILNSVKDEREGQEIFNTLDNVAARFLDMRLHYLGSVPQDQDVVRAVRDQMPFVKKTPHGKAAKAVLELAQRLVNLGEEK